MAEALLREHGNPEPPISLELFVENRSWQLFYDQLDSADGYTARCPSPHRETVFAIVINTEVDERYSPEVIRRRQRFTLAHEIGHILLHGHYNWHDVPPEIEAVQEVEAQWFASRLLMPEYLFKTVMDLDSRLLAERCHVNKQAAETRLKYVSEKIIGTIVREASKFYIWGSDETITEKEIALTDIEFAMLAAAAGDGEIMCMECGTMHSTGLVELSPICMTCGTTMI